MNEVQILELKKLGLEQRPEDPRPWYDPVELSSWVRERRWYLGTVIAPTMIAAFYLLLVAADRYEAEAKFVVRSPSSSTANQLTNLVQGSGIVRSSEDAYIVHAYIKSRDAVRELASKNDLLVRLDRPEADILWQYPKPWSNTSDEGLWKHFQNFIKIDFDSSTGITTLKVQAFRPEDARDISLWLLESSERLINTMSNRAQQETVRTAEAEVAASRKKAQGALEAIREFRKQNELIDPSALSTAVLEIISRLAFQIALTKAELSELKTVAADSPQAQTLERRIAAFEDQISQERKALAGTDKSLAPLIAQYERLALEREFAERAFASAQAAFDIARIDAERQRLFIERISTPSLPDYPKFPTRLFDVLAVFTITWLLFSIARRLVNDARSHAGN